MHVLSHSHLITGHAYVAGLQTIHCVCSQYWLLRVAGVGSNVGYEGAEQSVMKNIFRKRRMSCNVVIVGEKGVGKTALVNRFMHDSFSKVSLLFCEVK